MTKEEKVELVKDLTRQLNEKPNVYVTDAGGLSVDKVSTLRGLCFKAGIEMRVVKNTLLRKAMEASDRDYSGVFPELKMQSSVFFAGDNFKEPAKIIKGFRKKGTVPSLKVAYIDEAIFIGDAQLSILEELKGKTELIGEIITALQSPMNTVMGQLSSGGNTIAGLVKTLSERGE